MIEIVLMYPERASPGHPISWPRSYDTVRRALSPSLVLFPLRLPQGLSLRATEPRLLLLGSLYRRSFLTSAQSGVCFNVFL